MKATLLLMGGIEWLLDLGNGAFIFDHSSAEEYNGQNISLRNLVNEVIGNIYENPDMMLHTAGTK